MSPVRFCFAHAMYCLFPVAVAQAGEELPPEEEEEEEEAEQQPAEAAAAAADNDTDSKQQHKQQEAGASSGKATAAKPVPVVIKPKGLLATAQLRQKTKGAAAAAAGVSASSKPAAASSAGAAGGSEGSASAAQAAAQQLMKEFAQPVVAAAAQRVIKVSGAPLHRLGDIGLGDNGHERVVSHAMLLNRVYRYATLHVQLFNQQSVGPQACSRDSMQCDACHAVRCMSCKPSTAPAWHSMHSLSCCLCKQQHSTRDTSCDNLTLACKTPVACR
jgi:hypothetical protein